MSLSRALSSPDAKSRYVRRLFATIADRYDLITVLLSFGCDRRWKRRLVRLAGGYRGRALDLACGTGDITFELAAGGVQVVGLDITRRMIELARDKRRRLRSSTPVDSAIGPAPVFLVGDMMALPFPDKTFNLVSTGYGLRNLPVIEPALAEIYRVLRPDGRLLSLDFERPEHPFVRVVYLAYLTIVGSALGYVLHRDPDTYRYIPESIRRYPGSRGVAELMRRTGFREIDRVPLLGGLMAINRGSR